MKKLTLSALLVGFVVFASCGAKTEVSVDVEPATTETETETPAVAVQDNTVHKNVNTTEFADLAASGKGMVLDVRTDKEYNAGHIAGATQIDFYSDNFEAEIDKLDKNRPVYVYCRSGGRSGKTMNMMKEKGFTLVYNLDGGMMAWEAAGQPVEKESNE